MAILIRKNNKKVFVSDSGVVTNLDKERAEKISAELKRDINRLEASFIRDGYLTEDGRKLDALRIWYEIGRALNRVIDKHAIRGTNEEQYFWLSIYDYVSGRIQKSPPPKRSMEWRRNHFRLCAKMAEYSWDTVSRVGPWSLWRDLFDNSKLLEDKRVFDWLVGRLKENSEGHKEMRPLIHKIRRGLKNIDTSVLNIQELHDRLARLENEKSS
jgi:hypothetical protein